jgi:nucleolar complex protein 3
VHLSKKARKALREKKKEFNEAEAEVDKEERAATVRAFTAFAPNLPTHRFIDISANRNTQTAIRALLPNPQKPTPPLLPAALQGISKYAHLVNIDLTSFKSSKP